MPVRAILMVIGLNLSGLVYAETLDLESTCDSCLGETLDKSEFPIKPANDLDACRNTYRIVSRDSKFNELGYWYGEVSSVNGESLEIAIEIYGLNEYCSNFPGNKCPVRTALSINGVREVVENFPGEFFLFFPSLKAPVKGRFQEARLDYPPGLMGITLKLKLKPESGKFLLGEKGIIGSKPDEITIYTNIVKIVPEYEGEYVKERLITNIGNDDILEIWASHDYQLSGEFVVHEYALGKHALKKCESYETWGD